MLSAVIGDVEGVHWQFDAHFDKLPILHDTIANLELTLSKVCAGLSKVNNLLRVSGDILHTALTDLHGALHRAMLSRVLGGDLPDVSFRQAQDGVRHGGVGVRSATEHALLAFIASRTETRPRVVHIFEGMRQAGTPVDGWIAAFDAHVDAAIATLATRLDAAHMATVWQTCATAAATAEANFDAVLAERWPAERDEPAVARGGGLLVKLGVEDAEHPASAAAQHVQHRLATVVDDFRVSELSQRLAAENCPEAWHDARSIADLCDETTSMCWCRSSTPGPRATSSRTPSSTRWGSASARTVVCPPCGATRLASCPAAASTSTPCAVRLGRRLRATTKCATSSWPPLWSRTQLPSLRCWASFSRAGPAPG